jgi:predicted component of type VI protein secretion system
LVVRTPQRSWEVGLVKPTLTIGRSPDSDVFIDDPSVSRLHARIDRSTDSFVIQDLDSRNGTWVGPDRVRQRALQEGDLVRIGKARLLFRYVPMPRETTIIEALTDAVDAALPDTEIQIDQAELSRQVEEISRSDAFRQLQDRARGLRRPRR